MYPVDMLLMLTKTDSLHIVCISKITGENIYVTTKKFHYLNIAQTWVMYWFYLREKEILSSPYYWM
jgi:hypothetical protein